MKVVLKSLFLAMPLFALQNVALADPEVGVPGDGVRFPQNAVVYSIQNFNLPQGPGVSLPWENGRALPTLNVFHRCSTPNDLKSCIQQRDAWFAGCPIQQTYGLVQGGPSEVAIELSLGAGAYSLAQYTTDAQFRQFARVNVSYNAQGRRVSKDVSIPLKDLRYHFMSPGGDVAVFNSFGEQRMELQGLAKFRINEAVDDFKVSLCDLAPGIFQVNKLDIAFESQD